MTSATKGSSSDRTNESLSEVRPNLKRRKSWSVSSGDEAAQIEDAFPRKRPPPTGAELDRIHYHISLKDFGSGLQKAANAIFPGDQLSRYTNVDVILLSWEDEDPKLPVSIEVRELADIFTNIYGYDVVEWLIPSENPHIRLQAKILQFLGDGDPSHLKIVYYGGHGRLTSHGQPAWTSLRNRQMERCSTVKWSGIQNTLEESTSDVLIFLDCCASGVCTTDEGNGVTELIAACAYNSIANGVGNFSFTHALSSKLRQMAGLPYFTTGYLYNAIFTEVQSWRVDDSKFKRPPIHLVLSQNHNWPRSIRLSSRLKPRDRPHRSQPTLPSPSSSNEPRIPSTDFNPMLAQAPASLPPIRKGENSAGTSPGSSIIQLPEYPRLLFSIRLSDDVKPHDLSTDLFTDWLRSVPVSAGLVRVEAGFASDSTILLLSTPASIVGYLASDPAITLVGTIRSKNFLTSSPGKKTLIPDSFAPNIQMHDNSTDNKRAPTYKTIPTMRSGGSFTSGTSGSTVYTPSFGPKTTELSWMPQLETEMESRGLSEIVPTFSEAEKRFVLVEAAKTSSIPIDRMLKFLQDENVTPKWIEMLLPHGRNLKECMQIFNNMQLDSSSSKVPGSLRTFPQPARMIRPLRPQSPQMRTVGSDSGFESRIELQPKKRGRPSKAEVEARKMTAVKMLVRRESGTPPTQK